MRKALSFAAVAVVALSSSRATADLQHVIGRGHTIEAIANRYHVTAKSIIDANKLTGSDVKRLKVGDVLTIPKTDAPKTSKSEKDTKSEKGAKSEKSEKSEKSPKDTKSPKDAKSEKDAKGGGKPEHVAPVTFAQKAKTPGVIHLKRVASTEEADLRVADRATRVAPATLKSVEKILRSPAGASHPIEARLVALLGVMSNHFGSRKIEVVSGFRPFTPTQYTAHSNHNHGKALDFKVLGVPNEVVRDFCRTLKNVGCGYYPNSTFVHMDVRETSTFWIDFSKPGEPPRYNAPNLDADEATSDVHSGQQPASNVAPTPTEEPAPSVVTEAAPAAEDSPAPAPKPSDETTN